MENLWAITLVFSTKNFLKTASNTDYYNIRLIIVMSFYFGKQAKEPISYPIQHSKAKQGAYKSTHNKETVGAAHKWAIGNFCQRMASSEIGYNKNHV